MSAEKLSFEKKSHKKSPKIHKTPKYIKEKNEIASVKNRLKQKAQKEAKEKRERLKVDASISLLTDAVKTLTDNTNENLTIRKETNILVK
jgi:hypothetical protein